ncbi:MAG: 8-amino-7-oxononanoate synthase [Planctomycetota bacterium]
MNDDSDAFDWIDERLSALADRHLMRKLHNSTPQQPGVVELDGVQFVNFASNDYLGLARDDRITKAVTRAVETYGWGSGASPLITGHTTLHRNLEVRLAEFEGCPSALLFPTGFAANVGVITALADKSTTIFSDAKNHASIIDGCRLSGANVVIYPHNDCEYLENELTKCKTRKLIVTDGLFSMDGDLAPIPEILRLAERHDAMLVVDEAHATAVLGKNGRGSCEHFRVESDLIVRVGTLSKALGSLGGFIVGPRKVIDLCTNRSRTLIYSTAAPAAVCAAGLAALEIAESEPERRHHLLQLADRLREQLKGTFDTLNSESQIVPIVLGEPDTTMQASSQLREAGFLVPGIRPPTVPPGESLLRVSLSYNHSVTMVDQLVSHLHRILGADN